MTGFGQAPIKAEGTTIPFDKRARARRKKIVETVYVERRVPTTLECDCHWAIDKVLRDNGFDPAKL